MELGLNLNGSYFCKFQLLNWMLDLDLYKFSLNQRRLHRRPTIAWSGSFSLAGPTLVIQSRALVGS